MCWFAMGCGPNGPAPSSADTTVTKVYVTEGIDAERTNPNPNPVAVYDKKLPNDLNDWHFKVQLFETKQRFVYKLKMQYEEITGEDDLLIPNLGFEPNPQLRRGNSDLECVVGFLDDQKQFRDYKLVSAKSNGLKVTTLKSYAVTPKQ